MGRNEIRAEMTAGSIGIQVFITINDKHYVIDKEGEWQHTELTTEEGSIIVKKINAPDPIEVIESCFNTLKIHRNKSKAYMNAFTDGKIYWLNELKRRLTEDR